MSRCANNLLWNDLPFLGNADGCSRAILRNELRLELELEWYRCEAHPSRGAIAGNLLTFLRLPALARVAASLRHIKRPSSISQFVTGTKSIWSAARAGLDSTKLELTVPDLPINTGLDGILCWRGSTYRIRDIIVSKESAGTICPNAYPVLTRRDPNIRQMV